MPSIWQHGSVAAVDSGHLISMNILLGDPPTSTAPYCLSYRAGDKIMGSVLIRSDINARFDALDICMIGLYPLAQNPNLFIYDSF